MKLWHETRRAICLAIAAVLAFATSARGSGLLLYETGAPDLGTASAGRAAIAADASTTAANPAGMTPARPHAIAERRWCAASVYQLRSCPSDDNLGRRRRQRRCIYTDRRLF